MNLHDINFFLLQKTSIYLLSIISRSLQRATVLMLKLTQLKTLYVLKNIIQKSLKFQQLNKKICKSIWKQVGITVFILNFYVKCLDYKQKSF